MTDNITTPHRSVDVFDKDGKPFTVSRLNALDLTRSGKFFWHPPTALTVEDEPEDKPEPVETTTTPEPDTDETTDAPTGDETEESKEPAKLYLSEEALFVAGYKSAEAYLNTFSTDALRAILEDQYAIKAHANTGKPKLIEKIIEADSHKE